MISQEVIDLCEELSYQQCKEQAQALFEYLEKFPQAARLKNAKLWVESKDFSPIDVQTIGSIYVDIWNQLSNQTSYPKWQDIIKG